MVKSPFSVSRMDGTFRRVVRSERSEIFMRAGAVVFIPAIQRPLLRIRNAIFTFLVAFTPIKYSVLFSRFQL